MHNMSYIMISILGGVIVPLQLAMVNTFRNTSGASQIQSTFVLYVGGAIASLIIALIVDGTIKPPLYQQASWWMWFPGFLGSIYILCMFLAAPQIGATFATIIDSTGLLGMQIRKIDGLKLLGLFFILMGGLILIYNEYKNINN